jgi:hypothetical protein
MSRTATRPVPGDTCTTSRSAIADGQSPPRRNLPGIDGTVRVVVPQGTPLTWAHVSALLHRHGLVAYLPTAILPVRRYALPGLISRWSTDGLLDPVRRFGAVHHAVGVRMNRLDLLALTAPSRDTAAARWWAWSQHIAATTPTATPWEQYLARHHRAPHTVPLEGTRRQFESQPRILAMLAYNSYPFTPFHFHPEEVGAYQAGATVYVALHWQQPLVGDALIPPAGQLLRPVSDGVADRLTYLSTATRIVHGLRPGDHLVAIRAASLTGSTTPTQ